jgi:RNA polymerase sigma-70 factor (ECF subfamily)
LNLSSPGGVQSGVESISEPARDYGRVVWETAVSASSDERALVQAAQRGDVAAFERLYRSTARLVYALCLRMTGEAGRAEELTQDVFVRAWQKLATFRGESAFATWLTRLAVNVVLSERRERRRRDERFRLSDDLESLPVRAPAPSPGTAVDLDRAIAGLPAGARRVFVLHDVEGWGHGEIARATGLAVGTCKSHLHRARLLLREALQR